VADACVRADDVGRGAVWNWKLGLGWRFNDAWDLGAGAYSDHAWNEPLTTFGARNNDTPGRSPGLRWRRAIGQGVELSTTLAAHYERGTGDFMGAALNSTDIVFPVPIVKTNAAFDEANLHLASGLRW
jgi:hypothetical protein